jgi:hypothetical protein
MATIPSKSEASKRILEATGRANVISNSRSGWLSRILEVPVNGEG